MSIAQLGKTPVIKIKGPGLTRSRDSLYLLFEFPIYY